MTGTCDCGGQEDTAVLIVIGELPSWVVYDRRQFPGFSLSEIRAGLTVPATKTEDEP